jgi:hypothetical protein
VAVISFTVSDLPESLALHTEIYRLIREIDEGTLTDVLDCGLRLADAMAALDRSTLQRGAPLGKRTPKAVRGSTPKAGPRDAEPKGRTPRRKGP